MSSCSSHDDDEDEVEDSAETVWDTAEPDKLFRSGVWRCAAEAVAGGPKWRLSSRTKAIRLHLLPPLLVLSTRSFFPTSSRLRLRAVAATKATPCHVSVSICPCAKVQVRCRLAHGVYASIHRLPRPHWPQRKETNPSSGLKRPKAASRLTTPSYSPFLLWTGLGRRTE